MGRKPNCETWYCAISNKRAKEIGEIYALIVSPCVLWFRRKLPLKVMEGTNLNYHIFYPKVQNTIISTYNDSKNITNDNENLKKNLNGKQAYKKLFHA